MSPSAGKMILSIDVEDWFHLLSGDADYQFKRHMGGIESWDHFPARVEFNTNWILDTLDHHKAKATFFVLGWVAEKHPHVVQEIQRRGHELASHGYGHKLVYKQKPIEFLDDLRRSVDVIENITGRKVLGYRASSASITQWALDILAEEGFVYDSSVYPATYHDVYSKIDGLDTSKPIERLRNGLWEVKMSSLRFGRIMLPWGGGGYFRLIPYRIFKRGVQRILHEQALYQFFLHPWELDPEAPRLNHLKRSYYIRRYICISRTRARFAQLLSGFQFLPIADVLTLKMRPDLNKTLARREF